MTLSLKNKKLKRKIGKWTPYQMLALFFMGLILTGSCLLTLPISAQGERVKFIDALFTATSAVCVTGLITVPTGPTYSYFGRTVIMMLIQFGGLGIMTFASVTYVLMKKSMSVKNMLLVKEALNQDSMSYLRKTVANIVKMTFFIEGIGAILVSFRYIPMYGIVKGIYFSIFHAISSFCNAGFDINPDPYMSLVPYVNDPLIILTTAGLIIAGGFGFAVIEEIAHYKQNKKLSLQARVVIGMTSFLLLAGTVGTYLLEMNNPITIGNPDMSFGTKVMSAFFQSVTTRTAGYNSIDQAGMTMASKLLSMILMFIGASPGSTGGGIKTTTFCIICASIWHSIRGNEEINFKYKRVSEATVKKAFTTAFIGVMVVMTSTMIIMTIEPHISMDMVFYDTISAFGTVGLTMGITPTLSSASKIVLILTMYAGRVGPITLLMALTGNKDKKKRTRNVESGIMIG